MLSINSAFFESLHKEQWQEVRLGEVAEIVGGGTPKTSVPEYWGGNIAWLSVADFNNGRKYVSQTQKTITELGLKNSSTKILNQGDIIISARGTVGVVAMLKTPMAFNQTSYGIKSKELVNNHFIYYMLKNASNSLVQNSYGSVFNTITSPILNNYTFLLPPLKVQQQIAEILSSFDDKIDLLHRQNKTLESLALTLFRHTFIDNPNRNEWEEVTLNDICLKIASGGTPSTKIKEYYSGKINWYSTKELDDNFLFDSIQMITESGLENSSAKLFPKDTIIIAIYAAPTVGRLGILTRDSAFNQAACGLIIDETKCSKEFVFCFLKNERENLNLLASGSAQQNLNVEKIKRYALLLPDKTAFNDFQIQAKGFFDKIYNNAKQIQNLQSMRDMLLAKILNDKMEV